jgi:fructose-bisphosphate aldolase class 1
MVDHGVFMAGSTLKPNIVNPGRDCPKSYTLMEIAEANIFVLKQSFPVAMKGANYLSGGQTLDEAAARLNVINRIGKLSMELEVCCHCTFYENASLLTSHSYPFVQL